MCSARSKATATACHASLVFGSFCVLAGIVSVAEGTSAGGHSKNKTRGRGCYALDGGVAVLLSSHAVGDEHRDHEAIDGNDRGHDHRDQVLQYKVWILNGHARKTSPTLGCAVCRADRAEVHRG